MKEKQILQRREIRICNVNERKKKESCVLTENKVKYGNNRKEKRKENFEMHEKFK